MWPTIGESRSRLGGSSLQFKSGKEKERVTDEDQIRESSFPGELPSKQPSYSAAVGIGDAVFQMKITEEDGEHVGLIPNGIMDDVKPLWTDLLVGKFPSKYSNLKDIFYTVNKIWTLGNRNIRIEVYKVSDTLVKFRIPDKSTRERVLKRGMWSILGMPMILSKWAPIEELEGIEVRVVPIWITIKRVPRAMFHWKGISCISKVVGKPIKLHPETIQCVSFDEAKILVEADLNTQLPKFHKFRSESKGAFSVDFLYPWVPRRCTKCFQWGHSVDSCHDKNVTDQVTEQKQHVEDEKESNNLEPEQPLAVQITSGTSSNLLMKRDLDDDSSKAAQGDSTGSRLKGMESHKQNQNGENISSGQRENSYERVTGKMRVNAKDPLDEIRMVKEGLRQVSPDSSITKKDRSGNNCTGKEDGNIESPNTQLKGSQNENGIGSPQEEGLKTVHYGGSSKQSKEMVKHECSVPLSNSRFAALADSVEEMEVMISNNGSIQDEDENEGKENDYDSQVEKFLDDRDRSKTKNKEKEGKKLGTRGRGRGRKPKK